MTGKPKMEDVVKALMKKKPDAKKDVTGRTGARATRENVDCYVYACPRGDNCKNDPPVVSFPKNTGWKTPYSHLVSCLAGGKQESLHEVYKTCTQEGTDCDGNTQMSKYFQSTLSATPRERAMFRFINVIIALSLPITYVENPVFREFASVGVNISMKALRETLFKMVELVEMAIRTDMKSTHGAVMHDGWSTNGSHYLGVFAVFMKQVKSIEKGNEVVRDELCMPLLSLSPIAKRDAEGEVESGYAITFDAESHIRQLEHVFHYFHVDVHVWAVCQIADSCSLNKCIAERMKKPHIGCCNHKLALQVNRMVSAPAYERTLDMIRTVMRKCKSSIKTRAMLQRLTDLAPIIPCATRWSGLCTMVKRFIRIRPELEEVAATDGVHLTISSTPLFETRCKKLDLHLGEINTVTKALQRRGVTLEECRYYLDTLTRTIEEQKDNPVAPLFGCTLKDEYIKLYSVHSPSSTFESAVVKIQRQEFNTMTPEERSAALPLKKPTESCNTTDGIISDEDALTMSGILDRRKRRRVEQDNLYMNLNFILGSSAEIERLFSIAGRTLADQRQNMTPMLFEALVFLKVNRGYWDFRTVLSAMRNSNSSQAHDRVAEDSEQQILSEM